MLGTIELVGIGGILALIWVSLMFYFASQKRFRELEDRMIHNVQITLKELDELKARLKEKENKEE